MRRSRCLQGILAAVLAMLCFGPQAQAAQFLYTISGIVTGEELTYDEWHVFDPIQGQTFTAEFLVDDSSPLGLYSYSASGSSATGGAIAQLGTRAPVTSKLTIGANTYAIRTGDYHSYPTIGSDGDPNGPTDLTDELGSISKGLGSLGFVGIFGQSHSCCFPHPNDSYGEGDYLEFSLFSSGFTDPDYRQTGTFAVSGGGYFGKNETFVEHPGALTQIILSPSTLTVTQLGAVPEIGTWLMMITGIGAIGLAVRNHRKSGSAHLGLTPDNKRPALLGAFLPVVIGRGGECAV